MGRIDAPPAKRLRCATLATGMKCLTKQKVASGALSGNVLHDCHAEMLALRAFNRFLLDECRILARKSEEDKSQDSRPASEAETVVEWRRVKEEQHTDDLEGLDGVKGGHGKLSSSDEQTAKFDASGTHGEGARSRRDWTNQPFKIKATVKLHMYCSEAPCGDASMELTMAAQEDATPWTTPSTSAANTNVQEHLAIPERDATGNPGTDTLYGRSYFSSLGVVRRKPSRPDAPPTLSKSCSDKLALKQCTSVLSSTTSLLIHPGNAYLGSVVVPESQYVRSACQRAFGEDGRMAPIARAETQAEMHRWGDGYGWHSFTVRTTSREFSFSRRTSGPGTVFVASNLCTLAYGSNQETLINGVIQGRKQGDPRGASTVSRRKMWQSAKEVAELAEIPSRALVKYTYGELKSDIGLETRGRVKKLLRSGPLSGWQRNVGDEGWTLE